MSHLLCACLVLPPPKCACFLPLASPLLPSRAGRVHRACAAILQGQSGQAVREGGAVPHLLRHYPHDRPLAAVLLLRALQEQVPQHLPQPVDAQQCSQRKCERGLLPYVPCYLAGLIACAGRTTLGQVQQFKLPSGARPIFVENADPRSTRLYQDTARSGWAAHGTQRPLMIRDYSQNVIYHVSTSSPTSLVREFPAQRLTQTRLFSRF